MLMLGHAGVQAPRRDTRYRMFHVEQIMGYKTNIEQQNLLNQFLKEHILSELSKEQMDKLYDFADLVVETKQFGNLISAKDS